MESALTGELQVTAVIHFRFTLARPRLGGMEMGRELSCLVIAILGELFFAAPLRPIAEWA